MYEATIENGTETAVIHELDVNSLQRLRSGQFSEEVSKIPSFTFTVYPQNTCFDDLHERTTTITLTNTRTGKAEFEGCVLQIGDTMDTAGIVGKKVTCEGFMGYLQDSRLLYRDYGSMGAGEALLLILQAHNAIMPAAKQIQLGQCDMHDTVHLVTMGRSALEEIKENLVSVCGGELRVRRVDGVLYLDYMQKFGSRSLTTIELAKNMKSISLSRDSTNIITRLIPLGAQLSDETEERLTIAAENGGCPYIDDADAMAKYGVICATAEFDDITDAQTLMETGRAYLTQNNRIKKAYKIEALDLSTIGLDPEAIVLYDEYRTVNPLLRVDEYLRVNKRTVDIYKSYTPSLEIGDKQEALTDITVRAENYIKYEAPKQKVEILAAARQIASELIKAGIEGYVVVNGNEILIMDTPDKETAQKLWRWNLGGLGYSSTGYDGEFATAITMDGAIVADFITAGVLRGIEITNGDGTFRVDEGGNCYASSINITGGSIHITTSDETYSVIELNCNEWHSQYSPLQWVLVNDSIGKKIVGQAGAIIFYTGDDAMMYLGSDGTMTTKGTVTAEEVIVNGGLFIGGNSYQTTMASIDLRLESIENRLTNGGL